MKENDKKLYEVSFLAKSENGAAIIVKHLTSLGAEGLKEVDLKKMKLAYPMKGEASAFFGCINCELSADSVSKFTDAVKLEGEIIRTLIVEPQPARNRTAEVPSSSAPSESTKPARRKPIKREEPDDGTLSNELLEEKLEEILQ